jgi:hypothetical protein
LERKQAQDNAIAAHAAALMDNTRIAAVVDRLHVLSKEHDRCLAHTHTLTSLLSLSPPHTHSLQFRIQSPFSSNPCFRLSDSRGSIKNIVDTLSDKVSDAKGNADDLQQNIQDVKYEEHDKLEAARIGF